MTKVVLDSGYHLRDKILEGVNTLADCVGSTLGPKGQNVLVHKKGQRPFITKDGVTVAKSVQFEDPFVNAGAEVVKQVSAKTNLEAGDGTTTSTVLAREIMNQAHKFIGSGASPIELKRGLDQCLEAATTVIQALAKPISSASDIEHIASISANNDADIGKLVATAVDKVGKNGSITVEEARSLETSLNLVEGFRFDSGYCATAFVTDERKGSVRYDNPLFFITDSKIELVQDILPALEIAARENRPFVIVADDIEGQALAALIMNTIRGSMKVAAIKAPRYGEERRNIMSDLSLVTGAKYFKRESGDKITEASLKDFGTAKTVEINKGNTVVVDGGGTASLISERIDTLVEEIRETENTNQARRLQERVTRLSSGIAIIRVGASTEIEMIEKKHRIEDALEAVRSAQQEGVVPGGGLALFQASQELSVDFENDERAPALKIFKSALEAPLRTMATNAGLSADVVVEKLKTQKSFHGIDFTTGKSVNMVEKGIIDPVKVTRCALKNAVSVAGTLLLTKHSIIEV